MHALLITLGSSGDVHPFVAVGRALRARGHRVRLATNGHFAPLAAHAGLEFVELGTEGEYHRLADHPNLWHPLRGFPYLVKHAILPALEPVYDLVAREYAAGETVVVASTLALGARVAQEKLGVPLATVHLSPGIFASVDAPPALPGMPMPAWSPRWYRRFMFGLADAAAVRPVLARGVNAFRAERGLPPARKIMWEWMHSPRRVLALFPAWFAPPPADWPPQTRLTGFPLYDRAGLVPMGDEVDSFLRAGAPPVVFTPGSAMRHGRAFFDAALDACGRLGQRGVLLTQFPEHVPPRLPAGVRHFPFVPLGQLLPRAAALVFHGGIGTLAQGLAAGVPQLVMPLSHDQFDNAARLKRLGVGDALRPAKFTGANVAMRLARLLASADVARACRDAAARMTRERPLDAACDAFEELDRSSR